MKSQDNKNVISSYAIQADVSKYRCNRVFDCLLWALCTWSLLVMPITYAEEAGTEVEEEVAQKIFANLAQGPSNINYVSIHHTPIANLYRVKLSDGNSIFVDATGAYVISGKMFAIEENKFIDLEQKERAKTRAKLLAQIDEDTMLIYPAISAQSEIAEISIFTDVDCPYCSKLHNEIDALNRNGVKVRYLAYPMAGLYTPSHSKLEAVWCSTDPKEMLPILQQGLTTELDDCEYAPIESHFKLAKRIGVTGTPTIVFSSGLMLSGYHSAEELLAIVQSIDSRVPKN